MWPIYIALSKTFDSFATIVQKKILRSDDTHPITFAIVFQFITGLLIGAFGILIGDFGMKANGEFRPWNILIMLILYGFGNIFYFRSLKVIDASKFVVISGSTSIFTIITSVLFLKEKLEVPQIIGASFIFLGVLVVNLKKMKLSFGKGEFLALLGAAFFGFEVTNDKYLLSDMKLYLFLTLGFSACAAFVALFYIRELKYAKAILGKDGIFKFLLFCILYALQAIFFFQALDMSDSSSLVVIINTAGRIITVVLSIIFLKELDNILQKFLGVIFVVAGLFFL
ncbi:MAG: DMT family transporter [Candidatus Dojkabacteria bacterium]|jgi:drug/metabolite transporter (DMT)-like permease|nr:DMT family transporter [Candidatus Dojkabacteria bacterium]